MHFRKTTEYAIRVMTFLAENAGERFPVSNLNKRLNIPYKYLGRLMNQLAQKDLVQVAQGKYGGYMIEPSRLADIFLYQIVDAVEGLGDYDRCILGFPECSDEHPCALHHLWVKQREAIKKMLYTTSLADLVNRDIQKL
ncbi:Rrf2 family transcriptional regulator [candidate division KSB1 bacterium]|nr:MAG: Rrf2 family transcriptional regulator [candidate division KSB1 bacterium]